MNKRENRNHNVRMFHCNTFDITEKVVFCFHTIGQKNSLQFTTKKNVEDFSNIFFRFCNNFFNHYRLFCLPLCEGSIALPASWYVICSTFIFLG